MEAPLFCMSYANTTNRTHRAKRAHFIVMGKPIYFPQNVRDELLHVFENLKDEYAPNNADDLSVALKIKEAIANNSLTTNNLLELKGTEKYSQIMGILRMARLNFDLTNLIGK